MSTTMRDCGKMLKIILYQFYTTFHTWPVLTSKHSRLLLSLRKETVQVWGLSLGWAIFSTWKWYWNIDTKCCWHNILQILRHNFKKRVLKLEVVQLERSGVFVLLGCVNHLSALCYFCCHSGQNNCGRSSSKLWCCGDSSRLCRVLPLHPHFRRWNKNSSECHILVKPSCKTSWFLCRYLVQPFSAAPTWVCS